MNTRSYLTGAEAVISTLRAYGVDTIFGIPGVHTLPLYDVIYQGQGLRHVLARHEQGAGFMADGYARASGKPGVVCTITGPGATNVATPLADAYADSIPLLVISTCLPGTSQERSRGQLHELKNQLGAMESLVGWARSIESVEEIPHALHDAFHIMQTGRPQGAYLQIPLNLLTAAAEVDIPTLVREKTAHPSQEAIDAAAHLLRASHYPLIIAGAGVTAAGANEPLRYLAELLQAPVLLGGKSHDVLPSDHPLVISARGYTPGALQALAEHSDVALVVGSKLGLQRTSITTQDGKGARLPLPQNLIHIDIDPGEIGHHYPASVGVVADAQLALVALLDALQNAPLNVTPRMEEIAQVRGDLRQRTRRRYGEAMALLDSLRQGLPPESIVVADMTMLGYASSQYLPFYEPRTCIHPSELCSIGCGLPLALGAKVAAPERPVIALCGDGGFLLNAGELATASQEKIPVVTVIFNDSTYTAVKSDQRHRFNRRYIATDLTSPDYVALARSFHIQGKRAESPEMLYDAIREAINQTEPVLIEVPLPPWSW
ncbi:MAG: thiamine pyrophosphate-binding protein [Ktedonobacteraceae bacterium]|nr:thiamine pyrophosphate-binding protein [Ktedonobacteraceae bacterium]